MLNYKNYNNHYHKLIYNLKLIIIYLLFIFFLKKKKNN